MEDLSKKKKNVMEDIIKTPALIHHIHTWLISTGTLQKLIWS